MGFSLAMLLLVVPVLRWAIHGTLISFGDLLRTVTHPFFATLGGAAVAFGVSRAINHLEPAFLRLSAVTVVLFGTYAAVLLLAFGQGSVYMDLLKASGLWPQGRRITDNQS